jgi:transglutaminase-like putative cysteine protease
MAVYKIVHITKYQYTWPIKESINEIRLFPHNFDGQDVLQYQLLISKNPDVTISEDYYGNRVGNFNILQSHSETTIETRMLVRVNHSLRIPEIEETKVADLLPLKERNILLLRLCYPEIIKNQDLIDSFLESIDYKNKSIIEIAQACNHHVYSNFTYTKGITTIETTIDQILELKKGVCQDFAIVLLQLLRSAGIPSRYVSGYICPKNDQSGLRGEGATHAWVEFYSPIQGWIGLDPTNDIWTMDTHVKLSAGRNFGDCTLVKGTFKGLAKQTLSVSVSIGYEDGRHFEEVNNVLLNEVSPELQEQIDTIDFKEQQQQQQ